MFFRQCSHSKSSNVRAARFLLTNFQKAYFLVKIFVKKLLLYGRPINYWLLSLKILKSGCTFCWVSFLNCPSFNEKIVSSLLFSVEKAFRIAVFYLSAQWIERVNSSCYCCPPLRKRSSEWKIILGYLLNNSYNFCPCQPFGDC